MLKTSNTLLSIRLSSAVNRFVFYVRKLPLVGKVLPESLYGAAEAKRTATVLAWVLIVFWGLLAKLLYAGLFAALPAVLWVKLHGEADEAMLRMFLHIFLMLSFLSAGVSMATVLEPKREKWIAVKLMRMAPAAYMRTHFVYKYGSFFVFYVPVLMLLIALLGGAPWTGVLLAATLALWRVACEYAHLWLFARTGKILVRDNVIVWLVIGASFLLAYLPFLVKEMPLVGDVLLLWPVMLIVWAAGIAAARGLARYPDYRGVVDAAAKRDDPLLDMARLMTEAQIASVKTDGEDYRVKGELAGGAGRGEGYVYLNNLFFARHRKLTIVPVCRRLAFAAGLAVAGLVLLPAIERSFEVALALKPAHVMPYLPLAMSVYAVGERVCRALHYHCDASLMRYAFYRGAAIRHYRLRFVRLAGCNLAAGAGLAAALGLVIAAAGGGAPLAEYVWLGVSVLSLALFFTVHHLAVYYLLQPYTTELNIRNPLYFVVHYVVSILCGLCFVLRPDPAVFGLVLLAISAVCAVVSLLLVQRFGSRTFRLK